MTTQTRLAEESLHTTHSTDWSTLKRDRLVKQERETCQTRSTLNNQQHIACVCGEERGWGCLGTKNNLLVKHVLISNLLDSAWRSRGGGRGSLTCLLGQTGVGAASYIGQGAGRGLGLAQLALDGGDLHFTALGECCHNLRGRE